MKVKLLVEDRDMAWLFLDTTNAPEGCEEFDFTLGKGVSLGEVEDDEKVVWLATDTAIRVVLRETVDFDKDTFEKEWPIPSAIMCMNKDDWSYQSALNGE